MFGGTLYKRMTGCRNRADSGRGESAIWNQIRCKFAHLVRVLDQHILALGLRQAQIGDRANDTPAVGQVDVDLSGKFARLVPLSAENGVTRRIARVGTGDVTAWSPICELDQSKERFRRRFSAHPIFICSAPARIL